MSNGDTYNEATYSPGIPIKLGLTCEEKLAEAKQYVSLLEAQIANVNATAAIFKPEFLR